MESGGYLVLSASLTSKAFGLNDFGGQGPCGMWGVAWGSLLAVAHVFRVSMSCVFARGVSPGFGGCGVPREQTLPAVLRISFLWGWC